MFSALLDLLFPPRRGEARVRALGEETLRTLLAPALIEKTSPATIALLPFHDERVRAAIHEAKYHANERAQRHLAEVLQEYLADADESISKMILVPIPVGKMRLRERGYNQVEEILKRLPTEIGITIDTHALTRERETSSQVALSKEARFENMRGAFSCMKKLEPNKTYALIDDVVTTGATLQSAIDALSASGAIRILPIALAH